MYWGSVIYYIRHSLKKLYDVLYAYIVEITD
nr:MAG TPA_asm: hypothetical protein [Caudoviricetes sp.]